MINIHTRYGQDGVSRTYITRGRRISVIDGNFNGDSADVKTHGTTNPYLFGT